MDRVASAVESGKCALAVSGALLRDPEVVLALANRKSLNPMALSGPVVSPVVPVGQQGIARALAEPGGIVVLVEPESADNMGVQQLGRLLSSASNKPEVVVVSRNFNPFSYVLIMPGLAVSHFKGRGKAFLTGLPLPGALGAVPVVEAPKAAKEAKDLDVPKAVFVGRDDELATLQGMLGEGGPIVVSGPPGIGKSALIDQAVAAAGLKRHLDVVLGRGSGFDTLVGRLAALCEAGGDGGLAARLAAKKHSVGEIIEAALASLQAATLGDQVLVVTELHTVIGRECDFFRKSRLELLVSALLRGSYSLRLVFESNDQPVFFREGATAGLRRLTLGGIMGRFYHEIFEANRAGDVDRERFGPMSERLWGHPYAVKMMALAVRDAQNKEAVLDDPKLLRMKAVDDLGPVQKQIGARVEALDKSTRRAMAFLAHCRHPLTGAELADLGINRKMRLQLVKDGVLEYRGTDTARTHQVHRLASGHLSWREVSDFERFSELAEVFHRRAKATSGPDSVGWEYEANRSAVAGRKPHLKAASKWPDHDALVDSVTGLLKQNDPNVKMAEQRIQQVLAADPSNSDAWLMRLELLMRDREVQPDAIQAALDEALELALVPELVHKVVNWHLKRRARVKAIALLEVGVERLPDESRLRTRLASLLLKQGRRPEALAHLEKAMALDPMLPDAYGILGMARRDEGTAALEQAETLLREAVRLAPNDVVQVGRLVGLLLDVARSMPEKRDAYRTEAKALLEGLIKGDRKSAGAYLTFADLLAEDGELDRAEWMLKKARKLVERRDELTRRIRLMEAEIQLRRGELDKAEAAVRELIGQDPSNARLFEVLSVVLEARQLYIPAHAELLRAKERTAPTSLRAATVDANLLRLQAIIEQQAAGLFVAQPPSEQPLPMPVSHTPRVIRRRGGVEVTGDEFTTESGEAEAAADGDGVEAATAEAVGEPVGELGESTAAESEMADDEWAGDGVDGSEE